MKKAILGTIACVTLLTLSGCGSNGTKQSSGDGGDDKVTVWYYWEAKAHQENLNKMIEKYNNSQDKIDVEAKYIPFADFKKQLSIGASASELPDIVIQDAPDMASYASMGIYADITDKISNWDFIDQYYEGPMESTKLDGKTYGIPFGSNNLALYYNEELLDKAGVEPPQTWEELKSVGKQLTKDNVTGFAFSALQNEEGTFNFMPWVWSAGGDFDKMGSSESIKSLTFVKDLVDEGVMTKEATNWTQGDVASQFMSGNVAMMINGPWQIPGIEKEAPDMKWDVVNIPKDKEFASALGGENFGIINGNQVDESLDFVKFMSEHTMEYINDFGFISSRKDIAEKQFTDDVNPAYQKFADMLKFSKSRGPHPRWPEISDAISMAFSESITGTETPERAAEKAQETIDSILSE